MSTHIDSHRGKEIREVPNELSEGFIYQKKSVGIKHMNSTGMGETSIKRQPKLKEMYSNKHYIDPNIC